MKASKEEKDVVIQSLHDGHKKMERERETEKIKGNVDNA